MLKLLALTPLLAIGAHGPIYSGMPPERFQGDGAAVVVFLSDVEQLCGPAEPGFKKLACAFKGKDGVPVLVLPSPCPLGEVESFARLTCHELGHRNGWGGNHEF